MEKIKEKYIKEESPTISSSVRISNKHDAWIRQNKINLSAFVRSKIEEMEGYNGEETN